MAYDTRNQDRGQACASSRIPGLVGFSIEHVITAEDRIFKAYRDQSLLLDLSALRLLNVPAKVVADLNWLRELDLRNNYLCDVSELLDGVQSVEKINLSGNEIARLTDSVGKLVRIQHLSISHNQLEALPSEMGKLENITSLDVSNNKLQDLPDTIASLRHLVELNLESNALNTIPACIKHCECLEKLNLQNNRIDKIPDFLGFLCKLTELKLGRNKIEQVPDSICYLTRLKHLDLHGNRIAALPQMLNLLTRLSELHAYGNRLASLPKTLGDLSQLVELHLPNNRLTELPEQLGRLRNLQTLSLFNNKLESLPDSLGGMRSLQNIYVNGNRLEALPASLGKLRNLRSLWAFDNVLRSLSPDLIELARRGLLKELYLHGNDELRIPDAVLGPHWERVAWTKAQPAAPLEILEFYFAMKNGGSKALREFKVVIVGRGEVGKTTLSEVLQGRSFEPRRNSTNGISIVPWGIDLQDDVEGGLAMAHIWDFGGQQIMHGTHQFFMTQRALYLVVLDGRDDRAKTEAEYWLKLVRAFGGDSSTAILVLNKQGDKAYEIDSKYFGVKYGINPAHILRTECSDPYDHGVAQLRRIICQEGAKLLASRELFPQGWWEAKCYLASMRDRNEDFLSEEQFNQLCTRKMIPADQRKSLLRILSELGIVVSFPDDVSLSHLLVLNPEWVTEGVYRVLNDVLLKEKRRGQLVLWELNRILPSDRWNQTTHHKYLVDLMIKFELCFPIEGDCTTVLVPELLLDAAPDQLSDWDAQRSVVFIYRYPALPQGILPRFITRTHELSRGQERWRSGVVLEREGAQALVTADYDLNELTIMVKGRPGPVNRELLAIVRDHLESIHGRFEQLGEMAFLTVPGQPSTSVLLSDVLDDEEAGKRTIRLTVGGVRQEIPIKLLLEGVDTKKDKRKRTYGGKDQFRELARPAATVYNIESAVFNQGDNAYTSMSASRSSKVSIGRGSIVSGIVGDGSTLKGNTGGNSVSSGPCNAPTDADLRQVELQEAVERLMEEVANLQGRLTPSNQAKMEKNFEVLKSEASTEKPDQSWLRLSGQNLVEAAETCAAMAGPVVAATKRVLELLLPSA